MHPYLVAPWSMLAGTVDLYWVICLIALSRGLNSLVYVLRFHGAKMETWRSAPTAIEADKILVLAEAMYQGVTEDVRKPHQRLKKQTALMEPHTNDTSCPTCGNRI